MASSRPNFINEYLQRKEPGMPKVGDMRLLSPMMSIVGITSALGFVIIPDKVPPFPQDNYHYGVRCMGISLPSNLELIGHKRLSSNVDSYFPFTEPAFLGFSTDARPFHYQTNFDKITAGEVHPLAFDLVHNRVLVSPYDFESQQFYPEVELTLPRTAYLFPNHSEVEFLARMLIK